MSALRLLSGDWATLGEAAAQVRTEVFVNEQKIPADLEWDAADAQSLHCVVYDGEHAVGTGRLLPDAHIGRMAVLAAYRRRGVGSMILAELVRAAAARGESQAVLSAQSYVADFYAHHGFTKRGEPYDEVGIPHQEMFLVLPATAQSQHGSQPQPSGKGARPAGEERSHRAVLADASELFVRDWLPPTAGGRGVYLLHGLGEHVGRYDELARWFNARGWWVRGHDHIGHGQSAGRRGVIARPDQMLEHAAELIARFSSELSGPPLIVSQSMGAALAAALVHRRAVTARGLLLSAPAFATRASAAQRALAALLARLAPGLALDNAIDAEQLSNDPSQVRAYRDDPLVHRRICAGLYRDIVSWGQSAQAHAAQLDVPALLLIPARDRIVDPDGARRYAAGAPSALLRALEYPDMRHEPFHELPDARAAVFDDLERWLAGLDARPQAGNG